MVMLFFLCTDTERRTKKKQNSKLQNNVCTHHIAPPSVRNKGGEKIYLLPYA